MFVQALSAFTSKRSDGDSRGSSSSAVSTSRGWKRVRMLMRLGACTSVQREPDDDASPIIVDDRLTHQDVSINVTPEQEDALSRQSLISRSSVCSSTRVAPRSPSRLSLIRNSMRLSRVSSVVSPTTCAICLESMKTGQGQALFTAECSHTFHFSCIASNVRHGNLVCPVCRAKWKEVPWQAPPDISAKESTQRHSGNPGRTRRNQHAADARSAPGLSSSSGHEDIAVDSEEDEQRRVDPVLRILDESIANARGVRRVGPQEPSVFDDDEPLTSPGSHGEGTLRKENHEMSSEISGDGAHEEHRGGIMGEVDDVTKSEREAVSASRRDILVRGYPEVDAVSASEEREAFTVLVNLKSSIVHSGAAGTSAVDSKLISDPNSRAPLDLVTVLDVSGSMAGTKLLLLKRAMEFVIRCLTDSDRLSIVSFSSSARRLLPLRKMGADGRQAALRCVDSLLSTGGTNIADGLRKGAKVLEDRRMKNPVASIMLLSDGQDTYTMYNRAQVSSYTSTSRGSVEYRRFIPGSIRHGSRIPVHTFGFGADHDAVTLHSISEASGGTFSFIQTGSVIQDAFAQCIGGLLSVVLLDCQVNIAAGDSSVQITSVQAGSYESVVRAGGRVSMVKIGDLYAEEERDILVEVKFPSVSRALTDSASTSSEMQLLRVSCSCRDPITHTTTESPVTPISIARLEFVDTASRTVRLEVDRQRNRLRVAQSIVEAGTLADAGNISAAQEVLSSAKEYLLDSPAFQADDQLCVSLETELEEIQTRMSNLQLYERSGRAYLLSAQSSHFRQRATTRGDLSENYSREYQTPSMVNMIYRSQTHQPS